MSTPSPKPVRRPKRAPSARSRHKAHLAAVADVLHELSDDIEMLGAVLCTDSSLMACHMQELQTVDLIAQKQRALAMLLRADCPVSALSTIGLDDLKRRLEQLSALAALPAVRPAL